MDNVEFTVKKQETGELIFIDESGFLKPRKQIINKKDAWYHAVFEDYQYKKKTNTLTTAQLKEDEATLKVFYEDF